MLPLESRSLFIMLFEKDLRDAAASRGWPTGHVYQRLPNHTVYASICPIAGRYRNICVVVSVGRVEFFAVLSDEVAAIVCDSGISDDLVPVLFTFFHGFWMRPKLRVLDGQDVGFYRDLAAKLDLEVCCDD